MRPQAQPAYNGSQIRIKGRPPLPFRRLDACKAASQQPRGATGAEGTPTGGNPLHSRWGSPPHHATPKRSSTIPGPSHCCPLGWGQCFAVVGALVGVVAAVLGEVRVGISVGTSREIRVKSQLARREKGLFRTYLEKVSILHGKTPSPNWVASRRGSSGRPQRSSSATEMPTA